MNPDLITKLEDSLGRGYRALVLTNAMRPMMKCTEALLELGARYGKRLTLRVSLDHYGKKLHELERGPWSWRPTIEGLSWLVGNGFAVHVAGRTRWGEAEESLRLGYAKLFEAEGLPIDAEDSEKLVLFPEMDERADVVEITEACWELLKVDPDSLMCAGSRMVVKRKGENRPAVVPCTLLPYGQRFEMGETLAEAQGSVPLNHPHCARFCVLGGGSCSATAGR